MYILDKARTRHFDFRNKNLRLRIIKFNNYYLVVNVLFYYQIFIELVFTLLNKV